MTKRLMRHINQRHLSMVKAQQDRSSSGEAKRGRAADDLFRRFTEQIYSGVLARR